MGRTRRILLGLLIAYAASMTLIAGQKSAEGWLYRRWYEQVSKDDPNRHREGEMLQIAKDFGIPRTPTEEWSLWLADV